MTIQVNSYVLDKMIGQGTFGKVYEVKSKNYLFRLLILVVGKRLQSKKFIKTRDIRIVN